MVPTEGLEPPHLAALGSKPSVSTNSTTSAQMCSIYIYETLIQEKKRISDTRRDFKFYFFNRDLI